MVTGYLLKAEMPGRLRLVGLAMGIETLCVHASVPAGTP